MDAIDYRKEMVQDVIDRLLYLQDNERTEFISAMSSILGRYQTKVLNVNGLRIVPSNSI
jgi:hypothetical protein